ncbi:MAG: amidohydrolase family protein, partial [Gemmatimonadota bacterium]
MRTFRGLYVALVPLVLGVSGVRAQERADLVVHNAVIFTADDMLSVHSAMAVRDGRVLAVGDESLVSRYRAPEVLDLRGRFVTPGFNDAHTHIRGQPRRYVDMSGVKSMGEFQDRLRKKAQELGSGEWITGWGWSEDEMAEGRIPTKADLDAAIPDNPAAIARAGGHSAVLNSLALKLAGIDRNTPDPKTGMIEHDSSGEPTGVIREDWSAATRLVPRATYEELRASLVENLKKEFSYGITSFIDAMTPPARYPMWQEVYREHRGELPRASVQIHIPVGFGEGEAAAARVRNLDLKTGQGDEWLRVGALKLFVDGGYTGPAAWTLEHYKGQPDYYGR